MLSVRRNAAEASDQKGNGMSMSQPCLSVLDYPEYPFISEIQHERLRIYGVSLYEAAHVFTHILKAAQDLYFERVIGVSPLWHGYFLDDDTLDTIVFTANLQVTSHFNVFGHLSSVRQAMTDHIPSLSLVFYCLDGFKPRYFKMVEALLSEFLLYFEHKQLNDRIKIPLSHFNYSMPPTGELYSEDDRLRRLDHQIESQYLKLQIDSTKSLNPEIMLCGLSVLAQKSKDVASHDFLVTQNLIMQLSHGIEYIHQRVPSNKIDDPKDVCFFSRFFLLVILSNLSSCGEAHDQINKHVPFMLNILRNHHRFEEEKLHQQCIHILCNMARMNPDVLFNLSDGSSDVSMDCLQYSYDLQYCSEPHTRTQAFFPKIKEQALLMQESLLKFLLIQSFSPVMRHRLAPCIPVLSARLRSQRADVLALEGSELHKEEAILFNFSR